MDGMNRNNIKSGMRVLIIQKKHQRTGKLTEGTIENILTNSSTHPHGIKFSTCWWCCRSSETDSVLRWSSPVVHRAHNPKTS